MKSKLFFSLMLLAAFIPSLAAAQQKPKIAIFAGPTATILNSPPLVTSNKARAIKSLPVRTHPDKSALSFDHLVPQRLAAPVEIYIEQFTGHPLEKDAAQLYGPPDGYVDRNGIFRPTRQSPDDKPVYRVTLRPEDGLYLLPYMALQADGKPWDDSCAFRGAPFEKCRQTYYPDASRIFEEINRGIGGRERSGVASILAAKANFEFFRPAPPGGYSKGISYAARSDVGGADGKPEILGKHFFPAGTHRRDALREDLAKVTNMVQKALNSGQYAGAVWFEGSPTVQDTTYWLSILIDTKLPITGNASQRAHGYVGNDGDRNIIDSVDYILSKVWADTEGRDQLGAVLIQDEQIFAARQVEKQDARPGGYRPAGGHGGILGTMGDPGPVTIWFRPTTLHTWKSAVNFTQLPRSVKGIKKIDGKFVSVEVAVKDGEGFLRGEAIPMVTNVRSNRWVKNSPEADPEEEIEILARIEKNLKEAPLAGFVAEGNTPYGSLQPSTEKALEIAAMSGMPVVRVSRGDQGGMVAADRSALTVAGNNLTPGKARLLLMAALMKFGSLPAAQNPEKSNTARDQSRARKDQSVSEGFRHALMGPGSR